MTIQGDKIVSHAQFNCHMSVPPLSLPEAWHYGLSIRAVSMYLFLSAAVKQLNTSAEESAVSPGCVSIGPKMVDYRKQTCMGVIYLENNMLQEKIVFYISEFYERTKC